MCLLGFRRHIVDLTNIVMKTEYFDEIVLVVGGRRHKRVRLNNLKLASSIQGAAKVPALTKTLNPGELQVYAHFKYSTV